MNVPISYCKKQHFHLKTKTAETLGEKKKATLRLRNTSHFILVSLLFVVLKLYWSLI